MRTRQLKWNLRSAALLAAVGVCLATAQAGQWRWAIKAGSGGLTAAVSNSPKAPPAPVQPAPQPPAYLPPSPTLPASPTLPGGAVGDSGATFYWSSGLFWGFSTGISRWWW